MQFQVGDVVRTTARLFGRKAGVFLGLALIGALPAWLVSALAVLLYDSLPAALLILLQLGASAVGYGWSAAAIIYYAVRTLRAEPPSIGETMAQALRKFSDVVAVYGLLSLAIALGTLLLVVPGVVFSLMFWAAVPVAAVEGGVISALRRSHELTNGRKWPLLGLFALWLLAALALLGLVVGAIAFAVTAPNALALLGATELLRVLGWVLWSVVGAASYYHLRMSAEG